MVPALVVVEVDPTEQVQAKPTKLLQTQPHNKQMQPTSSIPDAPLEQVCLGQQDTLRSSSTITTTTVCRVLHRHQQQPTTPRTIPTAYLIYQTATQTQTTPIVYQASTARQVQAPISGMTRTACHASAIGTMIHRIHRMMTTTTLQIHTSIFPKRFPKSRTSPLSPLTT